MAIGCMAVLFDSTDILSEIVAQWTPTYTQCMSHVVSNQKSLKKEFILYCSKKLHKLDIYFLKISVIFTQ